MCGGRRYDRVDLVEGVLDRLHETRRIALLKHGACSGADELADNWAKKNKVECQRFPADWDNLGPRAGPIRNKAMAESGADLCLAFYGGKGTRNMIDCAKAQGIPVVYVDDSEF